jgi:lipoate-protein ligase A
MELIRFDSDDPRAHLACDEALLEEAEAGRCTESLRLYELTAPAVVIGVGQRWREAVHEEACAADGVPVLRRSSGGGAVVLGPGCLCYSLVLDAQRRPELAGVRSTHAWAIGRIARALSRPGLEIRQAGLSDLALGERKVGGSAQRRRKRFVLQHGTLLYGFDLALMDRYLHHPADEPDYRSDRAHGEFCANLPLPRDEMERALRAAFDVPADIPAADRTADLAPALIALLVTRYANPAWNLRR